MFKMKNIFTRTISGIIFVYIVIGSILLGPLTFAIMMTVVLIWAMLEFYSIVMKDFFNGAKLLGTMSGALIFIVGFYYAQNSAPASLFLLIIPLLVLLLISQLYSKCTHPFSDIAYTITGVVYIALPLTLLTGMTFPSIDANSDVKYTPDILLGFFILLWTNDTFAYLTGIMFGKRRLFERISPKKSWEGFLGGLIFTVAFSLLIAKLLPIMHVYHWMAVAVIIVVFGVYGDIVESLLKRSMDIKDSGKFLPGHGGILDRFDSVFLAAPMLFFYLKMMGLC